jgi:hypothetical protein
MATIIHFGITAGGDVLPNFCKCKGVSYCMAVKRDWEHQIMCDYSTKGSFGRCLHCRIDGTCDCVSANSAAYNEEEKD